VPQASPAPASAWSNAAYGMLGAPLAMAALPLFVQIPAYYASHVGLALAPLGWVLFAARLLDMLQDPLFGHLLDRSAQRQKRWMAAAGVVLAAAFICLWKPPSSPQAAMVWLVAMLVLAYGAHSMLSIAYLSWGDRKSVV
jgi:Na+/melibiose symporter-like transporter